MIELNMQAALLIYSMCYIIGFVYLLQYQLVNWNRMRIDSHFLISFLLSSTGALLIYYRNDLSIFFSVIIANSFLVIGNMLLITGIRRILDLRKHWIVMGIVYLVFILLFMQFSYISDKVLVRIIIYNLVVIGIISYGLYSVFNAKRNKVIESDLMSPILLLIIIVMVIRVLGLLIIGESSNDFLSYKSDSIGVVVVGIANLLAITGILSLINTRIRMALTESERSKTSLLSNLPGFAYRCNNDDFWTMKFLSSGFQIITGYSIDQVVNNKEISFETLIHPDYRDEVRNQWDAALKNRTRYIGEYKITNSLGNSIWVWEQGIGLYDENNNCYAIEGFISNINSRKNLEKNLEFLSYKDSLTGLYNRRFIEEELLRLDKSRNVPISIVMGDINGLKFINDSFGHSHGDELIKSVGELIRSSLRGYELIARLGGDEFLIILEDTSKKQAKLIVSRILENSHQSKYIKMGLSISFGYGTKEKVTGSIKKTLKEAEDMMYKQKIYEKPSSRRNTVDAVLKTLFEKDDISETHSRNVAFLSKNLAIAAGLSQNDIKKAETSALLHDVGKIIISDHILTSDTLLTDEEYLEIQKHSEIGFRILNSVPDFKDISNIILCHHERPDGKGYPNKLIAEDIPYISKIISICDAYDAMVGHRLYRTEVSQHKAFTELNRCKGTQFDTRLVDIFIEMLTQKECDFVALSDIEKG